MDDVKYRLNPITGTIVPDDDEPMYDVVTNDGKKLWTVPHPDGEFVIDYSV